MNPHTEHLPAPPQGNLETPSPHAEVFDIPSKSSQLPTQPPPAAYARPSASRAASGPLLPRAGPLPKGHLYPLRPLSTPSHPTLGKISDPQVPLTPQS